MTGAPGPPWHRTSPCRGGGDPGSSGSCTPRDGQTPCSTLTLPWKIKAFYWGRMHAGTLNAHWPGLKEIPWKIPIYGSSGFFCSAALVLARLGTKPGADRRARCTDWEPGPGSLLATQSLGCVLCRPYRVADPSVCLALQTCQASQAQGGRSECRAVLAGYHGPVQ